MKKTLLLAATMVALIGFGSSPAQAGVVYDNSCGGTGCVNGFNVTGWNILDGFSVSDSFTDAGSTFWQVDVWMWSFPGDTLSQLDWAIGTSALGSDVASGTAAVTTGASFLNSYGYDISEDTFWVPAQTLTGTYWLTLQNGVVTNGDPVYWDQSDGPSSAFENPLGSLTNCGYGASGTCSESFDLGTPEPGTLTLLGAGLLAIGGLIRRRAVKQ